MRMEVSMVPWELELEQQGADHKGHRCDREEGCTLSAAPGNFQLTFHGTVRLAWRCSNGNVLEVARRSRLPLL